MQNITAPAVLLSALLLTPIAFLVTPSASGQAVEGSGSAVDFNGDGYSDLAIGVPNEGINGQAEAGMVNIIYGSPTGLSASSVPNQIWHQDSADVEGFPDTSEHFGSALAAGDFNDDGYYDLAIGTPFDYVNSIGGAGSVNILYGSSSGLSATATLDDQFWTQDSPSVGDGGGGDGANGGELMGSAVASGDFNDDGYGDLAASAPADSAGASSATPGVVNVIYGSAAGLSATTVPDDVIIGNNRLGGARALASGDFDGDGYSDLAMGQPFYDISPVFFEFHLIGAVTALYGSASVLGDEQVWHQDVANVEDAAEDDEMFGAAVSAG